MDLNMKMIPAHMRKTMGTFLEILCLQIWAYGILKMLDFIWTNLVDMLDFDCLGNLNSRKQKTGIWTNVNLANMNIVK